MHNGEILLWLRPSSFRVQALPQETHTKGSHPPFESQLSAPSSQLSAPSPKVHPLCAPSPKVLSKVVLDKIHSIPFRPVISCKSRVFPRVFHVNVDVDVDVGLVFYTVHSGAGY